MCLFILLLIYFRLIHGQTTAGLILARGGSKGVRLKNLENVGGVSLLHNSVAIAQKAGLFDITVSTDHPLIALEALRCNASVFRRSRITATDWAPSIWGALEFLTHKPDIEVLVLLQATSPFIHPESLREALRKINQPIAYDCVFSVTRNFSSSVCCRSFKLRWHYKNGRLHPLNFNIDQRPRRQSWDGELLETGSFYIARRHLLTKGKFQNDNCTTLEVPSIESLEVDTYQDLKIAKALLNANLIY